MGNGHEKQADSEGGKTKMNRIEDVTDYITECDKEVGEALEELEGGAVHVAVSYTHLTLPTNSLV